jgi:hypothetical protein
MYGETGTEIDVHIHSKPGIWTETKTEAEAEI